MIRKLEVISHSSIVKDWSSISIMLSLSYVLLIELISPIYDIYIYIYDIATECYAHVQDKCLRYEVSVAK